MRVRVRWWWFVLAFVGILIVGVPVGLSLLRQHNLAAYEADGEVLADLGYVMSWEEVEFPAMDAEVQARWRAWGRGVDTVQGPLQSWWYKPSLPAPEGVEDLLTERRRMLAIGLECLRAGVVAGMTTELARFSKDPIPPTAYMGDSLLAIRELAHLARTEAVMGADPIPGLTDLDRLDRAFHRPLTLIDLMILAAVWDIRDDTWLEAIRTRRVSRVDARAWLDENGEWLERSRSAWMGERLSYPMWMSIYDQPQNPFAPTTWYWSAILPAEMNRYRHSLATMEAPLGSLPLPPPPRGIFLHRPIISDISIPNLKESLHVIARTATEGRIKRLAARLSLDHQDGKPWPVDEAGVIDRYGPDVLDSDDISSGLNYHLAKEGAPRLWSDPGKSPRILPQLHRIVVVDLTLTEP